MNQRTRQPKTGLRRRGSLFSASLLVAALAGTLSCGGDDATAPAPPPPPAPVATSLTVSPATAELDAVGATVRLSAEVLDQNGRPMPGAAVAWSSGDASVATVDDAGVATAVGNGRTSVTATSGSASGNAAVTVAQAAGAVAVEPVTVELSVGDTARLAAAATDANGHAVVAASFAWTSGDATVATVDDAGLVTGVSVGEVAITASSGGASGSAAVRVSPPPEPPEPTGAVPEQALDAGRAATFDASAYFSDPEGGELAYAAASSDTAVATATVAGSEVTVTGTGPGRATVTLTATDPDGLSATQSFAVVVTGSVEDDFESAASLSDWEAANADIAVADGSLSITNTTDGPLGLAKRREMPALNDWTIQARMGRTTRRASPGVVSLTRHGRFTAVRLVLRTLDDDDRGGDRDRRRASDAGAAAAASRNYEFAVFDGGVGEWVLLSNLSGRSESVVEEPGGFTEVAFGHEGGDFVAYAGEPGSVEELFRVSLADAGVDGVPLGEIVSDVTGLWLANQGPAGLTALHDRVRATGTGSDATPPDAARIEDAPAEPARSAPVALPVASVTVSPSVDTLAVGDAAVLSARAFDAGGRALTAAEFSWSSSDASVAAVDGSGLVTAAGAGAATITATSNGASGSSEIAVRAAVDSVAVSPAVAWVGLGQTVQLSAEAFDADGAVVAGAAFSWSSSDASVAAVDGTGLVTTVSLGAATITAASGGAAGASHVTVLGRPHPDVEALEALYEATDGQSWTNNGNWLTDAPLGDWYGVTTNDDGRVVELNLGSNGLSGTLPGELGLMSELEILWLHRNELTGSIPPELGDLASLNSLALIYNQLTGGIPPELGDLVSLEWLYLAYNDLTGEIPPELGNLVSLERLLLSSNSLTGVIPSELGDLVSLEWLYLRSNDLTGEIPRELGNIASLERLELTYNDLTGEIPRELGRLANLTRLQLEGNDLSGEVPSELGNLVSLNWLRLSSNDLTGEIPRELGNLASLEVLHLGNTQLTGEIPPELGRLSSLEVLSLYDNSLTGEIPSELGDLASLEGLSVSRNGLTGSVPPELGQLASLRELYLYDNSLAGEIPPELGNLNGLTILYLNDNNLTGGIPPELGDLDNLVRLGLYRTGLTGSIPPELGRLTNLTHLLLDGNDLSGELPSELGDLTSLTVLYVSDNSLTGRLPESLRKLSLTWFWWHRNAGLCAPDTTAYRAWLAGIRYRSGPFCSGRDLPPSLGGSPGIPNRPGSPIWNPASLVRDPDAVDPFMPETDPGDRLGTDLPHGDPDDIDPDGSSRVAPSPQRSSTPKLPPGGGNPVVNQQAYQ